MDEGLSRGVFTVARTCKNVRGCRDLQGIGRVAMQVSLRRRTLDTASVEQRPRSMALRLSCCKRQFEWVATVVRQLRNRAREGGSNLVLMLRDDGCTMDC
jgi:hypothetical protein